MSDKQPIASEWNTDIESIPQGGYVERTREVKGKEVTVDVWQPDKLWVIAEGNFVGTKEPRIVMRTYWMPGENRWCGFCEDEANILAWMPYRDREKHELPPTMEGFVL